MPTTTMEKTNGTPRRPQPTRLWGFRRDEPWRPTLQFTPTAWLKLQCLCHAGETEIGGFGIMPDPVKLLVTEFVTVKQRCTAISVKFDDQAVADYFDQMVDRDLKPDQFARCWLRTHPGDSADPSGVDEETFYRLGAVGHEEYSVLSLLENVALHDREHGPQVREILAR